MRDALPAVLDLCGLGFLAWAAWTVAPALGGVVIGAALLVLSWRVQT